VRIFVFVVGTVLLLFTIIFLIVTISDTLTSRKVKKKEQIIEAFLGPLLGAKDATASQYLRKLLSLSKGDIQRLQELKAFLANPIQTKPFLQSVAKSDFSRPQIKQLPAILRRENFPPRIARRYPDGHLVPQFDFSNSMFVAKRLGSDELTIRQEIIPLIDELMTYLDKNQMPAKLAKILSDNFSSSLTSGTTILEATVE
jgi:hypothetical protein